MIKKRFGKSITFEGICGVGKTVQASLLKKNLQNRGISAILLSDMQNYTGEDIGLKIYNILCSKRDRFFRIGYPVVETLLLAALKAYDTQKTIVPFIKKGYTVIEDRSIDSFCTYQLSILKNIIKMDEGKLFISLHNMRSFWGMIPDVTIYMDLDPKICIRRAEKREGRIYTKSEKEIIYDQNRYYNQYVLDRFANRIIKINIENMSIDSVSEEILKNVLQKFKGMII